MQMVRPNGNQSNKKKLLPFGSSFVLSRKSDQVPFPIRSGNFLRGLASCRFGLYRPLCRVDLPGHRSDKDRKWH